VIARKCWGGRGGGRERGGIDSERENARASERQRGTGRKRIRASERTCEQKWVRERKRERERSEKGSERAMRRLIPHVLLYICLQNLTEACVLPVHTQRERHSGGSGCDTYRCVHRFAFSWHFCGSITHTARLCVLSPG